MAAVLNEGVKNSRASNSRVFHSSTNQRKYVETLPCSKSNIKITMCWFSLVCYFSHLKIVLVMFDWYSQLVATPIH